MNSANVSAIIDDRVFIGNLSSALELNDHPALGITHILSVCPDLPSRGPNHLCIPVADSEYEDLLIRLPEACRFIQSGLDKGGKVLVHCVMGVSRSTTVVCAYLMSTRHLSATAAIAFVRKRRPQVHPNYGFLKQLQAFAECGYAPSPANLAYIAWKRGRKRDITKFLSKLVDTVAIIPDKLFLNDDFPAEPYEAETLLREMGITHLLSFSPTHVSAGVVPSVKHRHIDIPKHYHEGLLLALRDMCEFIHNALEAHGQVLVHCTNESRASVVVCAYLMWSRNIPPSAAFSILEGVLPLFNPTRTFLKQLELFDASGYAPTAEHPEIAAWIAEIHPSRINGGINNMNAYNLNAIITKCAGHASFDLTGFRNTLGKIQEETVLSR